MYRIAKRCSFEAAHQLHGLPDGHKCGRIHGHSYTAEIILTAATLDPHGFVVDFASLAGFGDHIKTVLDHRSLNDATGVQPTSENLACWLHDWAAANLTLPPWVTIEAVRVSETPSTWAEYRP